MLPMEAASLVMERKMLGGIKERAERLAAQLGSCPGRGTPRRPTASREGTIEGDQPVQGDASRVASSHGDRGQGPCS